MRQCRARRIGLFGGEGSGKSTAGIVMTLNRLRAGCNGIMVSPDFEHFKKSLWPEFKRWCPPEPVVPRDRYRLSETWEAQRPFDMHFHDERGGVSVLQCGGIEDPVGWEGPNVNFAHLDEARRIRTNHAIRVLDGRIRIPGPNGEAPQLWVTTTKEMHWLYEMFGPIDCKCKGCGETYDHSTVLEMEVFKRGCPQCGSQELETEDPYLAFKMESETFLLSTLENEIAGNLAQGHTNVRRQSLTENEARVLLDAAWERMENTERFLTSMLWWDACRETLPPLGRESMVMAMDAGVSHDSFGMVGVTAHPTRSGSYAVRFVREWKPPRGGKIDFHAEDGPEQEVRRLGREFSLAQVEYDPWQLHSLATRLMSEAVVYCHEFNQQTKRPEADKNLFDLILARRLAHDGHPALRVHLDNADRKIDRGTTSGGNRKLRIVKRMSGLPVDLAVCASMATYACQELGL